MRHRTKQRIFVTIALAIIAMMIALTIKVVLTEPDRWIAMRF